MAFMNLDAGIDIPTMTPANGLFGGKLCVRIVRKGDAK
jgi:hypothetical protein